MARVVYVTEIRQPTGLRLIYDPPRGMKLTLRGGYPNRSPSQGDCSSCGHVIKIGEMYLWDWQSQQGFCAGCVDWKEDLMEDLQ